MSKVKRLNFASEYFALVLLIMIGLNRFVQDSGLNLIFELWLEIFWIESLIRKLGANQWTCQIKLPQSSFISIRNHTELILLIEIHEIKIDLDAFFKILQYNTVKRNRIDVLNIFKRRPKYMTYQMYSKYLPNTKRNQPLLFINFLRNIGRSFLSILIDKLYKSPL